MTYAPIAAIIPQYDEQSGFYLKFYQPSTTTPISMATDSTGATLLAKCQLDNDGFPTTDGTQLFIPCVDQDYDAYLFPSAALADANDTTNAKRVAQNIDFKLNIENANTVADMKVLNLDVGQTISTNGYYTDNDGGNGEYLIYASSAQTVNNQNKILLNNGSVAVLLDTTGDIRKYGAQDGQDSTAAIQAAIDTINLYYVATGGSYFCLNLSHKNDTKGHIDGELKLPDNSDFWDSILINTDTTNGNKNIKITGKGTLNGNATNQTKIGQYLLFFYKCSDCELSIKTLRENFAPDPYTGDTPPTHPLSPFDFGESFGEASLTNPEYAAVMFIDGINNHVKDFSLLNWGREGVFLWYCSGSSVTNFTAINGAPTNNKYYEVVNFGSLNTSASLSVGDNVHCNDSHSTGGKPYTIYKSLVAGTTDLTTENFLDAARWLVVERDTTLDYGYTAARAGGAGSTGNTISNGYASFCRASSFSNDSVNMIMSNLTSYHNSFQVGINFGHNNTPASGGVGSSLIAINSGWKGGLTGTSYGISVVGATKNLNIGDFYVVGAGRAGINISSNGDKLSLTNGSVRHSAAQGLNVFQATVTASNIRSINNPSDFNLQTGGLLNLSNCEDTNGVISSQQIDENNVARTYDLLSRDGKIYNAYRALFQVNSGDTIATLTFDNLTSNDNMTVEIEYSERNTGSSVAINQYAVKQTVLVSGSGGTRTINVLSTQYEQLRNFRYTWSSGVLSVYLVDELSNDVAVNPIQNSIHVKANSKANSNMAIDLG